MILYLVWHDNGYSYEDRETTLIRIYRKREKAESFVENFNKNAQQDCWGHLPSCSMEAFDTSKQEER